MISNSELDRLFRRIDKDSNGTIEINELTRFVWGEDIEAGGMAGGHLISQVATARARNKPGAAQVSASLEMWYALFSPSC